MSFIVYNMIGIACSFGVPMFAMWLTSKFLTPKCGAKRWGLLRYGIFVVSVNMIIYVADPVNILYTLPLFALGIFFLYTDEHAAKLAMLLVLYPLIMSINAVIDSTPMLHNTYQFMRLIIWLSIFLAARRLLREERYTLSPQLWKLVGALSLLPMCAILSIVSLSQYGDYERTYRENQIAHVVLPFVFFCSLVLLYAISILYKHEQMESENQLYQIRALYWNNIEREQIQIRRLRHDIANHLTALSGLLDAGDEQKAKEYLKSLQIESVPQTHLFCEHSIINAVLSAKAAAAESEGLQIEFTANIPAALPIADLDLAALFGNALDNAIEAARGAEDKRIILRARADKGLLMLRVQNAYQEPRRQHSGTFHTTKENGHMHGFGLKTMETIARRYQGTLEAHAEDGTFDLIVVLPIA